MPWFTNEERPQLDCAPFEIYSIGEEISTSFPVSLAWSPPGLARHRRCALGVLTSNLVLSIWEPDGDPQRESAWSRVTLVNDTLREYFSTHETGIRSYITSGLEDVIRLRQRVRAFAWAPGFFRCTQGVGIVGTNGDWLPHILALSNDDNQIVILTMHSPTSKLEVDGSWSPEVVAYFSIAASHEEVDVDSFTFDDIMNQQRHASHVSWSPWVITETGLLSVLAYATNEDIRLRQMSYFGGKIKFGSETICPNVELRFSGPMTWSAEVGVDGLLLLSYFTTQEVVFLTISPKDNSILNRKTHHLDGRWDRISGTVWDTHDKEHPRIHFSSHTTTTRSPTAVLQLSSDGVSNISTSDWPYWREQISGRQGHFSAEHELKGHANARVWGLSASPLGEYVASVHTLHPTDMIEYGVSADRASTISINNLWGEGNDLNFPAKGVTAEGIFFTTRKWIERNVESSEELPKIREEIHNKLMQAYLPPGEPATFQRRPYVLDLVALISAFKQNAFLDPNTLKDRYDILSSCIATPVESTLLPKMLIAFRLAKELRNLPTLLSSSHEPSQRILKSHQYVIRLVEELISENDPVPNENEGEQPEPEPSLEFCTFCDAPIPFEDPFSATCPNGHEFVRCGLSFLTIQAPDESMTCGICKTPFFMERVMFGGIDTRSPSPVDDEEDDLSANAEMSGGSSDLQLDPRRHKPTNKTTVDRADTSDGNQTSAPAPSSSENMKEASGHDGGGDTGVTLAEILFFACDVCIYCGGKYVG